MKGCNWTLVVVASLIVVACQPAPARTVPLKVGVSRVGDDGLTVRFVDELEKGIRLSKTLEQAPACLLYTSPSPRD